MYMRITGPITEEMSARKNRMYGRKYQLCRLSLNAKSIAKIIPYV
eukprot:UN21188